MCTVNNTSILQDLMRRAEDVFGQLGLGQKERVYARALNVSLNADHIGHRCEVDVPFMYNGQCVGNGRADLIIDSLIVEIKATNKVPKGALAQVAKYVNNLGQVERKSFYGVVLNFCQTTGRVILYSDFKAPPAIENAYQQNKRPTSPVKNKGLKADVTPSQWDMYALRTSVRKQLQPVCDNTRSKTAVGQPKAIVRSRFFKR